LNQCPYLLLTGKYRIMKPYLVNFLNAIVYIALGSWGYLSSDTPSVTALIPVIAGIILVAITPGFRKGNRVLAHIAVSLTFVILLALFKPLTGSVARSDGAGIARVIGMIITSVIAMAVFIKSFIDARKNSDKT
jgi:choline-glycine betaine transporter